MKKLLLIATVSMAITAIGSATASAQEKERVVTGTISIMSPTKVQVLDEYISNQLYSGGAVFPGLNVELRGLYKNHDNLSWNLEYTGFNRKKLLDNKVSEDMTKLTNPAKTQSMKYSAFTVGYGTYYHWNFGKKLMLKAGGIFDLYGAMKTSAPDGVNNYMNVDAQMMIKAHAGIKYGWDFKKWALDIHGRLSLPLFGLIAADHPSEPSVAIIQNDHSIMKPEFNHIFLASYHNYMSLDYEIGIDFVLKPCTLTLGIANTSKWWNVYDIQNIRKINCMTIGISFDLVTRNKFKTSNKNF